MICQECIVEMVPNKRKLGTGSHKWVVCPKCGCRLKKDSFSTTCRKKEVFFEQKKFINSNQNEYKEF